MGVGVNLIADLWSYSYPEDDSVGGAQPSGTVVYENFQLRLRTDRPVDALLQQGIENIGSFTAHVVPHTVPVEFNNEIEIKLPVNSPYYGKRFRVVTEPERTSMSPSDSRGYLIVRLKRVEKSRSLQ
jgi:hypothetical protein